MAEETFMYTPTCHLAVAVSDDPCGPRPNHYWPETEANLAAGLATRLTMTEAEAAHYGTDLRKLGPADAVGAEPTAGGTPAPLDGQELTANS